MINIPDSLESIYLKYPQFPKMINSHFDQKLYNQEIMTEFRTYIATAAGGGRLRKNVITRKLQSGFLKNARTKKSNKRIKMDTRKMNNKSRKRRTRRSKR